jgi:3-oxoacyl-[acyl-carrier-protein] synthase-3
MATVSVGGVAIKGIACCVPKNTERNRDITSIPAEEMEKFIDATGIEERRIASAEMCTSDLCFEAASKIIDSLNWNKEDINILVFVSQTGDYILPNTATILQSRLGLSNACIAFDVTLGCSGYVYGLSVISSMMKSMGLKKGLLLVGDTSSKLVSKRDKSTFPLFGDAGSATGLESGENYPDMMFDLGTDGAGHKSIIVDDGGSRNPFSLNSLEYKIQEGGIEKNACQLELNGMDVFSFGISQVPLTVKALLAKYNFTNETIDFFVFHQANQKMNKMIAKKLKLPEEKVPYSLKEFGNTSSATVPLTIVACLKNKIETTKSNLLLCGFGVGLSWGTAIVELDNVVIPDLIEI